MVTSPGRVSPVFTPPSGARRAPSDSQPMLSIASAWRILCKKTGVSIGRNTFYRRVSRGTVYSIRLGGRVYIPLVDLEELIKRSEAGEKF